MFWTEEKCPIWGTPARIVERKAAYEEPDDGSAVVAMEINDLTFDSPRAGGRYMTGSRFAMSLERLSVTDKVKLTNWIVEQNRFGNIPQIAQEILEKMSSRPLPLVSERADRILILLGKSSGTVGDFLESPLLVGIDELHNMGMSADRIDLKAAEIMAWSSSIKNSEVVFLFDYLQNKKMIEYQNFAKSGHHFRYKMRLSPEGYARLSELYGSNPDSSQAFVAMWFDGSMTEAFDKGIEPAIRDSGYNPVRIDRVDHIDRIDDRIIAEIRRSRFIVADFTAGEVTQPDTAIMHIPRGGVYFEAGFAQGLNIPVIWSCRKDQIGRIHFDTRQFNHITWETPDDLYEQLKNRIGAVIGDGPIQPKKTR